MSISTRFDQSREILKDLCLLSPQRILNYSNGIIKTLPEDAFNEIEDWSYAGPDLGGSPRGPCPRADTKKY